MGAYLRDYEEVADTSWKPCPFCGGRPTIDTIEFYDRLSASNPCSEIVSVYCQDCGLEMNEHAAWHDKMMDYYDLMDILRKKWNRRVEK